MLFYSDLSMALFRTQTNTEPPPNTCLIRSGRIRAEKHVAVFLMTLQSINRSLDFTIIGQSGWLTADTEEGLMDKVPIDLGPKGWKQRRGRELELVVRCCSCSEYFMWINSSDLPWQLCEVGRYSDYTSFIHEEILARKISATCPKSKVKRCGGTWPAQWRAGGEGSTDVRETGWATLWRRSVHCELSECHAKARGNQQIFKRCNRLGFCCCCKIDRSSRVEGRREEETGGQRIVRRLLKGNLRLKNVGVSGEHQACAGHGGSTGVSAEVPVRWGPEEVTEGWRERNHDHFWGKWAGFGDWLSGWSMLMATMVLVGEAVRPLRRFIDTGTVRSEKAWGKAGFQSCWAWSSTPTRRCPASRKIRAGDTEFESQATDSWSSVTRPPRSRLLWHEGKWGPSTVAPGWGVDEVPLEGENQEERKDKRVTFGGTGWTRIMGPDRSAQGCCRRHMGKHCPRVTSSSVLQRVTGAQGAGEAVPGCAGLTGTWDLRKQRQRDRVF